MAHPIPDHSTVSAAELQNLHEQMLLFTARVGLALERAGIDITGAIPLPAEGNVYDLDAYRARRLAVS